MQELPVQLDLVSKIAVFVAAQDNGSPLSCIIILSHTLNLPHPFLFQALHLPPGFATAAAASANATDNLDSKTKQVSKAKDYVDLDRGDTDPKTLFSTLKSKKGTDGTTSMIAVQFPARDIIEMSLLFSSREAGL